MKEFTMTNINETLKQCPCWTDPPDPPEPAEYDNDEVEQERQAQRADYERDRNL